MCDKYGKKKTGLSGKSCGFGGSGTSDAYVQSPSKPSEACLYKCVNNKQVSYDCKNIPECSKNTDGKTTLNPSTFECYSLTDNFVGVNNCPSGSRSVTENTQSCDGRILCTLGITGKETHSRTECVPSNFFIDNIIPLSVFLVFIIIIVFFLVNKPRSQEGNGYYPIKRNKEAKRRKWRVIRRLRKDY